MINTKNMRRLYDAAVRDKKPQVFMEELSEALETGEVKPDEFSIKQLAEEFIPNGRELVDSWNPNHGPQDPITVMEAGAISSAIFSNITGQIVYTKVMEGWKAEAFVFSAIVPDIQTQFNGEIIPGISRLGDEAEIVDELAPYPLAAVSEDYIQTPMTIKRGTIVALSKEAVFFDRTGILLRNAGEVGEALGLNKEKRLIDAFIDLNTTSYRLKWKGTSYGTYQSSTPWINLKTANPLTDWSQVNLAEQVLAQILDPWTNEPIMNEPKDLVVTRVNLYQAKRIVHATEIDVATPGYAVTGNPTRTKQANPIANYRIVSSQLLSKRISAGSGVDTSWWLGDIAKQMNYMQNWPLTVTQGPANSEVEFTHDIVMRWKVSERGTPAVVEPRVTVQNNAS